MSDTQPRSTPEPVPERDEGHMPLPVVGALVTLGSEDAPACSDGSCW